jgi:small-conductance mechanosensitive channel
MSGWRARSLCRGALWTVLLCAMTVPALRADDASPPPSAAPSATAPPPIPLADVATKADEVGVFLQQLDGRVASGPAIDAISSSLPVALQGIADRSAATQRVLNAQPGLREVDSLSAGWRNLRDQLNDWTATVTGRVNELEREIAGLDDLRAIWRATRERAKTDNAPGELIERIDGVLSAVQAARRNIEGRRKDLLVLQDRLVEALASMREPIKQLDDYRRDTRLFVADVPPLPSGLRAVDSWSAAWARVTTSAAGEWRQTVAFLVAQGGRVLLPIIALLAVWEVLRRGRQRAAKWLADDPSLARAARVFESPISAALVVALVVTRSLLTDPPPLLDESLRALALLPALYILRRLVDPPLVPALWALMAFYITDRFCRLLAPQPVLEQALFMAEMSGAALFLAWLLRSGRVRAVFSAESRWAAAAQRTVHALIALFLLAAVAAGLGFMQLARYLQEALVDSSGFAVIVFGVLQVLEGLWAFLLRTLLRRLRMVERHRPLLQLRGERLLGWLAFGVWLLGSLVNARLLEPIVSGTRGVLDAQLTIGTLSVSLGALVTFALTVWLSFVVSRFVRFLLEEDVFPRVQLTRGVPYALSNLVHYTVLFLGFLFALAAMGIDLNKFTLLAGAFGVGIGFGLQNIVNNFVSGLILLFERPIQVGDIVQLANVSGEVRRIGIRSSTLRTGEGADVIVPNGDFISGSVTNWTLTDRMRRIDVAVGVAYGSDPEKVLALLRAVAGAHAYVVEAPKPVALFIGFGDSALNFELRAWTDHFDQWVATRSELAVAIHAKLDEAGIDVPFPQRDINVVPGPQPLVVRVLGGSEPPRQT